MPENRFAKYPVGGGQTNRFAKYPVGSERTTSTGPTEQTQNDDLSPGAVLSGAAHNFTPSAKKFAGGVAEAIIHPIQSLNTLGDAAWGAVLHAAPGLAPVLNQLDKDPSAAQRMIETADALGGVYRERYVGRNLQESLAKIAHTIKTDPVGFAGDASIIFSGGAGVAGKLGLARTAKVAGTLAKVANPLETNVVVGDAIKATGNALRAANAPKTVSNTVGAIGNTVRVLGPEVPANFAAKTLADGVGLVRNALNPEARAWLTATEGEGPAVVQRAKDLMKQKKVEIVPGSKPTLSEAVSDLKLTKLARFTGAAEKHLSTQATRNRMANEAAQMDFIDQVAKTDKDLADAQDLRRTKAGPAYARAGSQVAKADKGFVSLLDRPSMDDVIARARRIAAEDGAVFQMGKNTPGHVVPPKTIDSTVLGPNGQPFKITEPGVVVKPKFAKYKGDVLHYMKLGFDDLIKDIKAKHAPGVETAELRKIYATRQKFLDWVEQDSKIPDYKNARLLYEGLSEPIDRMLVGRELRNSLAPIHGEGASTLRSNTYENAMNNATRTVKLSTGKRNIEKLDDVLLPEEMDIVNRLRDDLRRSKLHERLVKAGQDDPNLKTLVTDAVGDATPPSLFNPIVTVAKSVFERLKDKFDDITARSIASKLIARDLNIPVDAIEKALSHETKVSTNRAKIERSLRSVGKATRVPIVYNALAADKQGKRNALNER